MKLLFNYSLYFNFFCISVIQKTIVSHSVKKGAKEENKKNYDEAYVAIDPLHKGIRRSSRTKITNTRLSGYDLT